MLKSSRNALKGQQSRPIMLSTPTNRQGDRLSRDSGCWPANQGYGCKEAIARTSQSPTFRLTLEFLYQYMNRPGQAMN